MREETPLGLYLHVPFCVHRCGYCDFATVAGQDDRIPAVIETLRREIRARAAALPASARRADTVFLGGGTPSHVPFESIAAVLDETRAGFELLSGAEVSLEANPESVSEEKARGWARAGVNRVSIGAQSFDAAELHALERAHDAAAIDRAVERVRAAGIENVNLDLMAAIPGQTRDSLRRNLDAALSLEPAHLSVYLLETDKPTPLAAAVARGEVALPSDDDAADFYEDVCDRLAAAGFEHYEISNWALAGRECRHNLKYWTGAPFLGFGLAAHSFFRGGRRANPRSLDAWSGAVASRGDPSEALADPADGRGGAVDALLTGLRLRAGVSIDEFRERHGLDPLAAFGERLRTYREAGLLEIGDGRLRLTRRGVLLSNEVFSALLDPQRPTEAGERT